MATHRALPIMLGQFLNFDVVGSIAQPTNPKENTIWVNTGTKVHHWSLNGKEPARVSNNKNLLVYPYYDTTRTVSGITFTDNKDGSITVNGTATANVYFNVRTTASKVMVKPGRYTISGCPAGGSSSKYSLIFRTPDSSYYIRQTGSPSSFLVEKEQEMYCFIHVQTGQTVKNLTFKPQVEKGSSATSFVKGDAKGQVWIKTLKSKGSHIFNGLKTNSIDIQLDKAYQWNGSKWNEVKGMVFHSGKWTQISGFSITYLYDYGTQNIGWVAAEGGYGSGSTTFNSNSVKLDSTGLYGSGGRYQSMYTQGKINLTEYTKLKVVVSGWASNNEGLVLDGMSEHNGFFRMGITNGHSANIKDTAVRTINLNPKTETNAKREVIMDISDITGEYYIGICIMAYRLYDYSNSGYVYSVSLHKD